MLISEYAADCKLVTQGRQVGSREPESSPPLSRVAVAVVVDIQRALKALPRCQAYDEICCPDLLAEVSRLPPERRPAVPGSTTARAPVAAERMRVRALRISQQAAYQSVRHTCWVIDPQLAVMALQHGDFDDSVADYL